MSLRGYSCHLDPPGRRPRQRPESPASTRQVPSSSLTLPRSSCERNCPPTLRQPGGLLGLRGGRSVAERAEDPWLCGARLSPGRAFVEARPRLRPAFRSCHHPAGRADFRARSRGQRCIPHHPFHRAGAPTGGPTHPCRLASDTPASSPAQCGKSTNGNLRRLGRGLGSLGPFRAFSLAVGADPSLTPCRLGDRRPGAGQRRRKAAGLLARLAGWGGTRGGRRGGSGGRGDRGCSWPWSQSGGRGVTGWRSRV